MSDITVSEEWRRLSDLAAELDGKHLASMFTGDPQRAGRFSVEAAGLFLDYSKNKITAPVKSALIALAGKAGLAEAIKAMTSGEKINNTENRAVLHVALRDFASRTYHIEGEDASALVRVERDRMKAFADRYEQGKLVGFSGQVLDTIVNIGIGGSDLGPQMAVEALRPYWLNGKRAFFVSNVDGQHLSDVLAQIDPARTLFIVASKTFTTQETMTNAASARDWFSANGGSESDIAKHFIALSTNTRAVEAFGIDPQNMFQFWDWVGGRYSMWSAIGMSIALQVGFSNFERMLRGAHIMDEHFRTADLDQNVPVLLALIGVWNRNFMGIATHAVLPYDQHLLRLPAYLQQADMESNGKGVTKDGERIDYSTGPVIFGEPGTNGQHAFYQLIHQGTDVISSDFIAPAISQNELAGHHVKLLANFLAQPEALMLGKAEAAVREELEALDMPQKEIDALAPHKVFPGGRPTNSILFEKLTPEIFGSLVALYEHKIFCQGIIWGINSFDQWGVELGKVLAISILPEILEAGEAREAIISHDSSTNQLINKINSIRAQASS